MSGEVVEVGTGVQGFKGGAIWYPVKDISRLWKNAETVWKGTKRTAKMPKVLG